MELNFLVFPAPKPSYTPDSLENEILWIPAFDSSEPTSPLKEIQITDISMNIENFNRFKYYGTLGLLPKKTVSKYENRQPKYHIPCLLLKPSNSLSHFILIYFHGNGEDVYLAYDLLSNLRNNLQINVMAVEYPGYGIYKGSPSAERIIQDSIHVYDYIVDLGFKKQNILVLGRSIGSGAATELAVKKEIGILALISPFTSLKDVVKEMVGSMFKFLLKERFNNMENIAKINCPTLLVHGSLDTMIPVDHSFLLHGILIFNICYYKCCYWFLLIAACRGPCELVTPKNMNHFQFDFYDDFTQPFKNFLERCGILLHYGDKKAPIFPNELFINPL